MSGRGDRSWLHQLCSRSTSNVPATWNRQPRLRLLPPLRWRGAAQLARTHSSGFPTTSPRSKGSSLHAPQCSDEATQKGFFGLVNINIRGRAAYLAIRIEKSGSPFGCFSGTADAAISSADVLDKRFEIGFHDLEARTAGTRCSLDSNPNSVRFLYEITNSLRPAIPVGIWLSHCGTEASYAICAAEPCHEVVGVGDCVYVEDMHGVRRLMENRLQGPTEGLSLDIGGSLFEKQIPVLQVEHIVGELPMLTSRYRHEIFTFLIVFDIRTRRSALISEFTPEERLALDRMGPGQPPTSAISLDRDLRIKGRADVLVERPVGNSEHRQVRAPVDP